MSDNELDEDARLSLRLLAEFLQTVPLWADDGAQLLRLLDAYDALRERLRQEEQAHGRTISERDNAQEWADRLAYSVAPIEVIGEHSSANNPWANAVEHAAVLRERDKEWKRLVRGLTREQEGVPGMLARDGAGLWHVVFTDTAPLLADHDPTLAALLAEATEEGED